jgi:hypothetical protein
VENVKMLETAEDELKFQEYENSFSETQSLEWGIYDNFQLVGHGKQTNGNCGRFVSFKGCLHTELHDKTTLDGLNYKGKVYIRKVHASCDKPTCPICYKSGWAVREADRIAQRIHAASKISGVAEHIIVSVPKSDYGLDFEKVRSKAVKVLYSRGVIGGVLIFHGFRYRKFDVFRGGIRNMRGWYWSPHFHCIGFILGGYGKCRHCPKFFNASVITCAGCGGFEARTRRLFEKDGYIVKVKGERKTIMGTAWYQLNHSSVKLNVARFHVATWFGTCSYRKLKVTIEKRKELCPICQQELVPIRYFGNKCFIYSINSVDYQRSEFCDMNEGQGDVWVEKGEHDFG